MADVEGKKLNELRVIDLKTELERRGLDKTGNKAALLDRLAKAIIKEGGDPDECLIIPSGGVSRSSPKKPIDTSIMIEDALETEIRKEEFNSNNFDGLDDSTSNVVDNSCSEELVINISTQPEEFEMECQENEQEPTITTTSEEPVSEKKSFISSEENSNVSAVEANGIDNEDSINLTIGEDEENLLAEESESNDRLKADGGEEKRLEESNDNSNSSINKKGDSKGSGRAESSASNKEGTSSLATAPNTTALKNKQDDEGCKSGDVTVKGPKKDDKEMSLAVSVNASSRNLWVSGLSSTTRATDLKQIFSKYGKVVGAKVVTNARTPGARCYGYVTMSTSDDAEKCIEYLHRTELHGRVISVEKAKGDSQQNHNRKREVTTKVEKKDEKEKSKELEPSEKEEEEEEEEKNESEKKMDDEIIKETEEKDEEDINDQENREDSPEMKDEGSLKDCDTRSIKSIGKKSDRERGNSREDKKRSWDRSRTSRSKSRERGRRDNEERERQRFREKERLIREEKRRRREDMERQRAIEREAARLEREREKLRMERERIEQEKAELLRLERERQKVEREKLERERLELKRQQMRMEETRRVPPPPALKRTSSDRREPRENYGEPERKRIIPEHPNRRHSPPERVPERRTDVMERVSERRVEAPVPSRYEGGRSKEMAMQKGFKRNTEFNPRNNREDQFSDVPRGGRDIIVRRDNRPNQNNMDHRPVKERYERPSFGRDREVHRSDDNHRSNRDNHNRYDNAKPNNNRDGRYVENNRQTGWHSGPPSKPFNSVNNHRNEQQTGWNSRSSDTRVNSRWNNSGNNMGNNNMGHPRSQVYQGGPTQSGFGMSQGNSGSYERFDPYKSSMQNMRKY